MHSEIKQLNELLTITIMKTTLLGLVTVFNERKFRAVWNEENETVTEEFCLDMKIDTDTGDYEWKYSLMDYADEIFHLGLHESMYFQGNRIDKRTKGFIVRIK